MRCATVGAPYSGVLNRRGAGIKPVPIALSYPAAATRIIGLKLVVVRVLAPS